MSKELIVFATDHKDAGTEQPVAISPSEEIFAFLQPETIADLDNTFEEVQAKYDMLKKIIETELENSDLIGLVGKKIIFRINKRYKEVIATLRELDYVKAAQQLRSLALFIDTILTTWQTNQVTMVLTKISRFGEELQVDSHSELSKK